MENRQITDGSGHNLQIGDSVVIARPDGLPEDIAKMNEECGGDWIYCGIEESLGQLFGVIIPARGEKCQRVMMRMDEKHREVSGILRNWLKETKAQQAIITEFLQKSNTGMLVNAYNGRW